MWTSRYFTSFGPLFVVFVFLPCVFGEKYVITKTWDNRTIYHIQQPVTIELKQGDNGSYFKIEVNAPFFNNTAPPGLSGDAFYGLWDYEVVEVFLLNDRKQYVEIELCPRGQHLVLLLNGVRNAIRHSLPIDFRVNINETAKYWTGKANIPTDYLPPKVTKMNSYAIHNVNKTRIYEALYPVAFNSSKEPDFHKLETFQPFDRSIILKSDVDVVTYSTEWHNSLNSVREMKIEYNGTTLVDAVANLSLRVQSVAGVSIQLQAEFYDDAPPPAPAGWPFPGLASPPYEVAQIFFMSKNRTLEVQFGPWGHYYVGFWVDGKSVSNDETMRLQSLLWASNIGQQNWEGQVDIPLDFFPPMVNKMNAYLKHGIGNAREIFSMFPPGSPKDDGKAFDFTMMYPMNKEANCSDIWVSIDDSCPNKNEVTNGQTGPTRLQSILLMLPIAVVTLFK